MLERREDGVAELDGGGVSADVGGRGRAEGVVDGGVVQPAEQVLAVERRDDHLTGRRVDLGEVPYPEALTSMAQWVSERKEGRAPDRLFLLSHPAVITYGKNTAPSDLPTDTDWLPVTGDVQPP